MEKFPNNGIFLSTKAELLYKLGRYDEAYNYIKKGIALEPNQAEIQSDVKMIEKALNDNQRRYYLDIKANAPNYNSDIIQGFTSLSDCSNTLNGMLKTATAPMECKPFDSRIAKIFFNEPIEDWYFRLDPTLKMGLEIAMVFSFKDKPKEDTMFSLAKQAVNGARVKNPKIDGLLVSPEGKTWNY